MARREKPSAVKRRIALHPETDAAVRLLAVERGVNLEQLAEEAFRLLLKKHRRPLGLEAMLRESRRMLPANDRAEPLAIFRRKGS
jgi:hypothetical protein